jgi:hypothetical protein
MLLIFQAFKTLTYSSLVTEDDFQGHKNSILGRIMTHEIGTTGKISTYAYTSAPLSILFQYK